MAHHMPPLIVFLEHMLDFLFRATLGSVRLALIQTFLNPLTFVFILLTMSRHMGFRVNKHIIIFINV